MSLNALASFHIQNFDTLSLTVSTVTVLWPQRYFPVLSEKLSDIHLHLQQPVPRSHSDKNWPSPSPHCTGACSMTNQVYSRSSLGGGLGPGWTCVTASGPADGWTLLRALHTLHQPAGCPVSTGWMDTLHIHHTTHCHMAPVQQCPPVSQLWDTVPISTKPCWQSLWTQGRATVCPCVQWTLYTEHSLALPWKLFSSNNIVQLEHYRGQRVEERWKHHWNLIKTNAFWLH